MCGGGLRDRRPGRFTPPPLMQTPPDVVEQDAPPSSLARRLRDFLATKSTYRYVAVGLSVLVFELLVIQVLHNHGASAVVAVGIGYWLGFMVSFALQKLITFGDRRMHHKVLVPQAIAFGALVVFNFGFTIALTKLLQDDLPAVAIRILAVSITTIWNFYLYKTRIFKTADEPLVF
jgi:putative flippase GtrA